MPALQGIECVGQGSQDMGLPERRGRGDPAGGGGV